MFTIALLYCAVGLHPIHLTLTEMRYQGDLRTIQVSIRVFNDDLEIALRATSSGVMVRSPSDIAVLNELIGEYILERFSMSGLHGQLMIQYLGSEMEEEATWIYLEIPKVRKLGTITVKNEALLEVYDDQENIIHFRVEDDVRSALLSRGKSTVTFDWSGSEK